MKSSLRFIIVKAEINKAIVSAIFTLLALLCTGALQAQTPDTALPIQPSYGVGRTEFLISAEPSKWTPGYRNSQGSQGIGDLWDYAHVMGFNVIAIGGEPEHFAQLTDWAGRDTVHDRLIMLSRYNPLAKLWQGGYGREVQFYPFDSVQSPFSQCLFYQKTGGDTEKHYSIRIVGGQDTLSLQERWYSSTNTSTGAMILSQPIFAYNPAKHIRQYPNARYDDGARDGTLFLQQTFIHDDLTGGGRTFYFATTGHMFDSGSVPNSTPIFRIAVYYNTPQGFTYVDNNNTLQTASTLRSILCDSFAVTKGDLTAGSSASPPVPLGQLREVVHAMDLRWCAGGLPGPMHPSLRTNDANTADPYRGLDIRVYWTGAERAALRSVAIRDSIGQLVLGGELPGPTTCSACQSFRVMMIQEIFDRLCSGATIETLRQNIIRTEVGVESDNWSTEHAGFNRISKMIKDTALINYYGKHLATLRRPVAQ